MLNKKYNKSDRHNSRSGLTLIELLLVLVILIGVGGLIVPIIGNSLTRVHTSTCAATFGDVQGIMERTQIELGNFGTGFDSGIDTVDDTFYNAKINGVTGPTVRDLTADEITALGAVGITSVLDHNSGAADFNPTFNINPGGALRDFTTDPSAVILSSAQADAVFLPSDNGEVYVWFGLGREWTGLGVVAPEPPTHFGDTAGLLPDDVHSRFGVIFQLGDGLLTNATTFDRAEFKRMTYSLDGENFETADNHIEVYWEEANEG